MCFDTAIKTKLTTVDAQLSKRGWYYGARIKANSTAAAQCLLYDSLTSTACSSTNLIDVVGAAANTAFGDQWKIPRILHNGLYADMNASNPGRLIAWVVDFNT